MKRERENGEGEKERTIERIDEGGLAHGGLALGRRVALIVARLGTTTRRIIIDFVRL